MTQKKPSPTNQKVQNYRNSCDELAQEFKETFYYDGGNVPDHYWVGGIVGGIVDIAGDFWNTEDMATALETEGATYEKLMDWYYKVLEEKMKVNLKNFLRYMADETTKN